MRDKKEFRPNFSVNEKDIKMFFPLVLTKPDLGYIEVRVINPNTKRVLGIGFFNDLVKLITACWQWNGKGNIYGGRNMRPRSFARFVKSINRINPYQRAGAHSLQIETVNMVSLDIDVGVGARPKGVPATDEEVQRAVEIGLKISRRYAGSSVVMTGNGVQVLFPIIPLDTRGRVKWVEQKIHTWEDGFRQEVESGGLLKLDPQFDSARIIKIPGTLSVKGKPTVERPHRMARFITYPTTTCDVINEILKNEIVIQRQQVTFNLKPVSMVPPIPNRFFQDLRNDRFLQDIYYQRRNDLKSASEYDLACAVRLAAYHNYPPDAIHSVLSHLPSRLKSVHPVKSRAYYDLTISKAMAYALKVRQQNLNKSGQNVNGNDITPQ